MERKLRYLEKETVKDAIPMLESSENPDAPQAREMVDLEVLFPSSIDFRSPLNTLQATFERLENELREVNANEEMLKKNYLELTELKHILRKTQAFFDEVRLSSFDPRPPVHNGRACLIGQHVNVSFSY